MINLPKKTAKILFSFIMSLFLFACNRNSKEWTVEVSNNQSNSIKKAYLYLKKDNLEELLIDSVNVSSDKVKFSHINTLEIYQPFKIKFDNDSVSSVSFIIKNKENLKINISDKNKVTYSDTPSAIYLNEYSAILEKETNLMIKMVEGFNKIDPKDSEGSELFRNKILNEEKKLNEDKFNFIKSVKLETLQSYFSLNEILTQSIRDKSLFEKFYACLSDQSKRDYYGKQIQDIITHFKAYDLLDISLFESTDFTEKEFSQLSKEDKNSKYGKEIEQNLTKLKSSFDIFSFKSYSVDGKDFDFNTIKDNIIVVDFWASWCGPCRMENVKLKKLYDTYKDKKFSLVSYSFDTKKANWVNAIKKDGISWYNISNLKNQTDDFIAKALVIKSLPSNIVVKNGVIVARNLNYEDLVSFIEGNL